MAKQVEVLRLPADLSYCTCLSFAPVLCAGLRGQRAPYLYTARMAIFDKRSNRFVGNVLGVRPTAVVSNERKWSFDAEDKVVVRCSCVQVRAHSLACKMQNAC